MTDERLGAQIEPVDGRHVQWGPPIAVLDVGVGPCLNEQLHTQCAVVGEGCVVERRLPLVVEGVEANVVLEQDVHHHVVPVAAGHVEGCATKGVDDISLGRGRGGEWSGVRENGGV